MNATLDNPNTAMTAPGQLRVIKRNGSVVSFDAEKISIAITKAFLAVEGQQASASSRVRDRIQELTERVVSTFKRRLPSGGTVHIEEIQDQVELALMRSGEHKVARDYVIYREQHAVMRQQSGAANHHPTLQVTDINGNKKPLDLGALEAAMQQAATGLEGIDVAAVIEETVKNLYDGVAEADIATTMMMATRTRIEQEPNYTYVTARLLREDLLKEGLSFLGLPLDTPEGDALPVYLQRGVELELLNPELLSFDVARLQAAIKPERSAQFTYLGLQTLYDRYFLHSNDVRFELPQLFFMRVAMGLAIQEDDREARAIEFYDLLSSFDYMASTPTLFNAGTLRPQLSSCYLTTVPDDLYGIYGAIQDNAMLSKWAGGLGNDWTPVRALGSYIKGTNGKSQGVVPFLKVANDTAVAVNQGGKRKGAVCAYLETWHLDIEEFLELRKNTGDDRRRTHDMNTANWVPDLFMQRVIEDGEWTLFSPSDTPDLHDLTGLAFAARYAEYEQMCLDGQMRLFKKIKAQDLWRKMLSMLFETGHPWITFKDSCNLRSPQQHVGVVHSSNLCCIAADQRVVTDRGMLTIGELYALGGKNKVVGLDGVYNASEMLLPRPNAPMVEIQTAEGYTHKVTPDHKVWVKDTGWVEAQHLQPNDKLLIQQVEGLWGDQHHPEVSYLMGLIAGDGTFDQPNNKVYIDLWQHDFHHIQPVEQSVHHVLDGNTVLRTTSTNTPKFAVNTERQRARLSSAPLFRILDGYGFNANTKLQVPNLVWQGSKETAAAYLRGLYQADGNIVSSSGVTTLALASTKLEFIQELQILWANFGVKSSINKMRDHELKVMPDGKGGQQEYWSKPLYRLLITSIQGCQIAEQVTQFAAHKASDAAQQYLANLSKQGYQQKLYATFTGLKQLPNEDAYCLMVDSDTHAWTVNGLITKNTEITLNTSADEIAVCNLGSINLVEHIKDGKLNTEKLQKTVQTAVRMLDNVIDINYYAVPQAKNSNLKHRPVGLGIMGFQDALYAMDIAYGSSDAVAFADRSMEVISYHAIHTSTELAVERGAYSTFKGSLWDQGILPLDSLDILAQSRPERMLDVDRSTTLDWDSLRAKVQQDGMRNSNVMAIAPTATISNICGVSQSIEPTFQNLYVKSNLSGEFTVINPYLVRALKARDLWDAVMVNDLKHYEGSVQKISRIPDDLKAIFATAFEVEPRWLVDAASRRQKWIDQAQSLNLYIAGASGKKLDITYKMAWLRGLKTTYYLRALGATSAEKSTITTGALNAVSAQTAPVAAAPTAAVEDDAFANAAPVPLACSIDNPDCEACQ